MEYTTQYSRIQRTVEQCLEPTYSEGSIEFSTIEFTVQQNIMMCG